ncbi:MAG: two-component sensor histidine kinase [Proteobacteria bacterium]|nr:two-component sensor histidine kinase [Pseudomonadota bacterium]
MRRLWPRSLQGQVLLALALALLLAQAISITLLFRMGTRHRDDNLTHTLAFRLLNTVHRHPAPPAPPPGADGEGGGGPPPGNEHAPLRPQQVAAFAPMAGDHRWPGAELQLREILAEQDMPVAEVLVLDRAVAADPPALAQAERREAVLGRSHPPRPERVLIGALRSTPGGPWLVVRTLIPHGDGGPRVLGSLLLQTLVIYLVLVGVMALVLRRIVRPLADLTARVEAFARRPGSAGALAPQGPDDLRRLIEAHNAMEARISALLDEKDVMLGAIGHDLKTPLAALRVRIESVEDEGERSRMAATIEDIVRSLDDLLSLARVGRPSDPLEVTELGALVAAVVEEFEDMGEPVTIEASTRIALPLRATWLRRALRNLIGNALRYGAVARVSLARESHGGQARAVVRIEDEGPGIPPGEIAAMMAPFTRGEPSRNSGTGGAGLGLTLARAIAEQHGGALDLANRVGPDGQVAGLVATFSLPL